MATWTPSAFRRHLAAVLLAACACGARAGDIVVIVHPSAPPMTKDEVEDVFLGRSVRAMPVDQARSQPIRAEFYGRATGRDLAQVKAVWSRVIFTGKGLTPKEYPDAAAVKRIVADSPRAVGYIEKSALDPSVKVAYEFN